MGEHCDQCQVTLSPDPGSIKPQDSRGPSGHPQSQILASALKLTQPPIPDAASTPHSTLPPLTLTSASDPCTAPAPILAPPLTTS